MDWSSPEERRALYARLLREERARIVPSCRVVNSVTGESSEPWVSAGQAAAAKGRATKRFFAMEREALSPVNAG